MMVNLECQHGCIERPLERSECVSEGVSREAQLWRKSTFHDGRQHNAISSGPCGTKEKDAESSL